MHENIWLPGCRSRIVGLLAAYSASDSSYLHLGVDLWGGSRALSPKERRLEDVLGRTPAASMPVSSGATPAHASTHHTPHARVRTPGYARMHAHLKAHVVHACSVAYVRVCGKSLRHTREHTVLYVSLYLYTCIQISIYLSIYLSLYI